MLTLFHGKRSRAFRALWTLEELGLAYRLVYLPFPPRMRAPWYLDENPLGTLPLLVDGDTRLTESVAVCQYLAGRYDVERKVSFDSSSIHYADWLMWPSFGEATMNYLLSVCLRYGWMEREENRKHDVVAFYKSRFMEKAEYLAARLRNRPFLVADRPTIADFCVGYNFVLTDFMKYTRELPATVQDYWARLQELPSYQRCLEIEQVSPLAAERPHDLPAAFSHQSQDHIA